jgi:hypothetical protein
MDFTNMEQKGDFYVGKQSGFSYSFGKMRYGDLRVNAFTIVVNQELRKETLKMLKKETRLPILVESFNQPKDTVVVYLQKNLMKEDLYQEKVKNAIEKVTMLLKEENYLPFDTCFVCKQAQEEELEYKLYGQYHIPLHESCASSFVETVTKTIEAKDAKTGNLPLSIFLAVIGAFIGLIPIIIALFVLESYFAILYALIPLASFLGYKLGKAPRKNYMTAIIVFLSVAVTIFFEYSVWSIIFALDGVYFIDAIQDPEILAAVIGDMAIALLFIGLGIWISWKYISNTTTKALKRMEQLK